MAAWNIIFLVSGSRMRLRETMGDLTYCDMSGVFDMEAICGEAGPEVISSDAVDYKMIAKKIKWKRRK